MVKSLTLMDIVPTHLLLDELTQDVARAYYHWFFLAQPAPFPETLIGNDPDFYYSNCLLGWGGASLKDLNQGQLDAYRTAWRRPETIRAMCDDYRATLAFDGRHDAIDLGKKLQCPTLVLYGADGAMAHAYDVPSQWTLKCAGLQSRPMPGGHFFVDTHPTETTTALKQFFSK